MIGRGWSGTRVARAIVDVIDFPARSLPSRIELRPSRPKR